MTRVVISVLMLACFFGYILAQVPEIRRKVKVFVDVHSHPKTGFTCKDKKPGEYYADPETNCAVYYICIGNAYGKLSPISFACPNGTIFNQATRVCAPYEMVYCRLAPLYYESRDGHLDEGGNRRIAPEYSGYSSDEEVFEDERPTTVSTPTPLVRQSRPTRPSWNSFIYNRRPLYSTTTTSTTPRPRINGRPPIRNINRFNSNPFVGVRRPRPIYPPPLTTTTTTTTSKRPTTTTTTTSTTTTTTTTTTPKPREIPDYPDYPDPTEYYYFEDYITDLPVETTDKSSNGQGSEPKVPEFRRGINSNEEFQPDIKPVNELKPPETNITLKPIQPPYQPFRRYPSTNINLPQAQPNIFNYNIETDDIRRATSFRNKK